MALVLPKRVPKYGFHYHYKHDPSGKINNYAYEVLSVNFHTETGEVTVGYRPLYPEAFVYQASLELGIPCYDTRPIEMWMGDVELNGKKVPRFQKIWDMNVQKKLIEIRDSMY